MRALLLVVLCGLSATRVVGHEAVAENPPALPDVYLVTIDTLRADHVHCYGYDRIQTPTLDGLAKDGVRFANAFTPSPITNTSHTSILTGLLPSAHGVTDFARPLGNDHPTLAEVLKKKGYQTAAFIGAVILDSKAMAPGLDRGFDFYDNFPEHTQSKSRWGRLERRAEEVVRRAEAWRDAHPAGQHFMWVHLYDPHDPYEPPPPYSVQYKDRLYDGEIAYADSALGNFVAHLKQHGWYDNALIVVVGDHGEGLGEHQEETHGIFLYDSTLHVPLICKLPGRNPSRTVQQQARTTDIFPTILDLLKIAGPEQLDGESLKTLIDGREASERTVIAETDYPLHFGWAPLRAVRAEGLKFIEAPRPEVYDLRADPGELKNAYEPWNAAVQRSRKILADRWARMPRSAPSSATVPAGTLDELRALGYLGPADAGSATNVPEPSLLPDPKDKIEEQNLLHSAMMAAEAGNSADARAALEKVLERNPNSEAALVQLGSLWLRAGDYEKASGYLARARELRPDDPAAALYQGQALAKSGDLAGAKAALEACVKLNPKQSAEARVLLGQVYLRLQDYVAAEDQFEATLLLEPESMDGHLGLARTEILGHRFDDALKELVRLSKSHPRNAEVFELLAQAYAGLGRKVDAANAKSRAVELSKAGAPAK
ncbi:MAG TPA: sulfatase-like hydrolase/transferase [Candidatus Dormibacteraeota bacterium]|nr:sulfatase-like hydrolase/transferase [Candidatus Dormibacteraeota bacterium]